MSISPFTRRVLTAVGFAALAVVVLHLLQQVAQVLLLVFAGVLLAIFLSGLAMFLYHRTPLSRNWALGLVVVVLLVLVVGGIWLAGPRLAEQFGRLTERIPEAIEQIRATLVQYEWGRTMLSQAPQAEDVMPTNANVIGRITGVFSTTLSILTNAFIVLIIGLYLAIHPSLYVKGVLHLVPPKNRERAHTMLRSMGRALRWWLIGRAGSMAVVGVLTTTGLLILGVPLAFTLGVIAALLSFVPYIGPIASSVPALLVGLVESPATAGYIALLYLAVQVLESNLINPVIQLRAVSLPPALLITAQMLLGVLAGLLGVLVATPLAVAVIVAVQMLYVEDMLGDHVKVMGSHAEQ